MFLSLQYGHESEICMSVVYLLNYICVAIGYVQINKLFTMIDV